jgi:serine/threonine protein kinase
MTGRMLSRYRLEAPVGAGGMGVVYRAYDTTLLRPVALKLLSDDVANDPSRRAVLREARAASRLNHPNICAIHEVGEADGLPFIVMEFVEGRVLTALIPADGLPIQTVLQLGIQIAGAIAHAHGQGIIHRDLKPGNVAVTPDGRVKILDFGVAARLPRPTQPDETGEATRTTDAAFAGTTAYMAPEALRGEPPRESADIWALGILLYEMATGHRPFRGDSASELVSAITRDPVTPPRAIHGGLRRIILRCLVKDPAQRYASAAEVRSALETITESLEQEAEEKPLAPPLRSPERSSYLWAAGAVMLVTVALALWWGTGRRSEVGPSNFRLLSTFPGAHRSATLSPDGGMVAFVDVSQDAPQVWVKNLAEGDPIQITSGDVAAQRPRWSPTSDRIVFGRRGGGIWECRRSAAPNASS